MWTVLPMPFVNVAAAFKGFAVMEKQLEQRLVTIGYFGDVVSLVPIAASLHDERDGFGASGYWGRSFGMVTRDVETLQVEDLPLQDAQHVVAVEAGHRPVAQPAHDERDRFFDDVDGPWLGEALHLLPHHGGKEAGIEPGSGCRPLDLSGPRLPGGGKLADPEAIGGRGGMTVLDDDGCTENPDRDRGDGGR